MLYGGRPSVEARKCAYLRIYIPWYVLDSVFPAGLPQSLSVPPPLHVFFSVFPHFLFLLFLIFFPIFFAVVAAWCFFLVASYVKRFSAVGPMPCSTAVARYSLEIMTLGERWQVLSQVLRYLLYCRDVCIVCCGGMIQGLPTCSNQSTYDGARARALTLSSRRRLHFFSPSFVFIIHL